MLKKPVPPFIIYSLFTSLILGWWYLAFKQPEHSHTEISITYAERELPPPIEQLLTPLNRQQIQKALTGDYPLMGKLIGDWDVDARILEDEGFVSAKRLSRKAFLQAQLLQRQLHERKEKKQGAKFLPQTYVAAAFLLTLSDPEEIVGIPEGVRRSPGFFPKDVTDKVPLNLDRFNSEMIYKARPDIAFIANYSQPATVQALRNQGIHLFPVDEINTLPEISKTIQCVGSAVNRSQEAELLTLFMEAAMNSIDNRLLLAHHDHPSRVLFLNHHAHYSMPTEKTITGHLIQRLQTLGFSFITPFEQNGWGVVIDQEKIVNHQPDCLIIACTDAPAVKQQLLEHSPLTETPAIQKGNLFFVDDDTQQSPTQFIVLAYYDLAEALRKVAP